MSHIDALVNNESKRSIIGARVAKLAQEGYQIVLNLKFAQEQGKEEDTNLRGTEGAIVQGANRLQRGMTYYKVGQQAAHSANKPFAWKVQLVPGAGHEVAQVIAPAGQLLFAP